MNATEAKILEAAEEEFLTKGFSGARTTSIAEAAGVTHAMLHYYFRTKEKLFDRVMSEKMAMLRNLVFSSFVDAELPLNEIIRKVIEKHLDFVAANHNLPRFLVCEVFSDAERSKFLFDKMLAFAPSLISELQRSIDDAASRGECRRVDARMLIIDIISLNIFSYMVSPLINAALGNIMEDSDAFLARRKIENYDTIMRKLKP